MKVHHHAGRYLAKSQAVTKGRSLVNASKGRLQPGDSVGKPGRIHVLGVGNLGLLFAHSLRWSESPPPITLLFHRKSLLGDWNGSIRILTSHPESGKENVRDGGYDVELVSQLSEAGMEVREDIIDNLILTTKTVNTINALSSIKHRLSHASTILFAQNGMGTIEEVNEVVFPDASSRPNYLSCVVSHGVYGLGPFRIVHAGLGTVSLGRVEASSLDTSQSRYLLEQVVHAPDLVARELDPLAFKRLQLQKLVVNAMINPLTVIFDCRNDALFNRQPILSLMRRLLAEASQVIRSLPELQEDPAKEAHFSQQELENVVLDMAVKTGNNTSSMLQDVRAGKPTEIDYINGYLVRRGDELGVQCGVNRTLVELVKGVRTISADEIAQCFP